MMMILEEMKKVPSCNTLNREFCDSKWVVNKEGKKFCAGNEHGELVGLLAGGGSDNVTCSCAGSNILTFQPVLENTDIVTLGLHLPGCNKYNKHSINNNNNHNNNNHNNNITKIQFKCPKHFWYLTDIIMMPVWTCQFTF